MRCHVPARANGARAAEAIPPIHAEVFARLAGFAIAPIALPTPAEGVVHDVSVVGHLDGHARAVSLQMAKIALPAGSNGLACAFGGGTPGAFWENAVPGADARRTDSSEATTKDVCACDRLQVFPSLGLGIGSCALEVHAVHAAVSAAAHAWGRLLRAVCDHRFRGDQKCRDR